MMALIQQLTARVKSALPHIDKRNDQPTNRHAFVLENSQAIHRSPYYAFILCLIAFVAFLYSVYIFFQSTRIIPTKEFIPSTTSDTAVHQIPLNLPVLPVPNQELNPGKTLSEKDSEVSVRQYMIDSLNDCFSMNYLNKAKILVKCMGNHYDSQSNAKFEYIKMLMDSNYLNILNKYETSVKLHIDKDTINLIGIAEVSTPQNPNLKRALWLYELEMYYEMDKVNVTSPSKWQVEMIREESFDKEFPVSIFKIRDME